MLTDRALQIVGKMRYCESFDLVTNPHGS